MRVTTFAILGLLASCVSRDDPNALLSTVRAHNLGHDKVMITCVDSARYCAEQANRSCPHGFDVISNTTNPADFGRMTMIISCGSADVSVTADELNQLCPVISNLAAIAMAQRQTGVALAEAMREIEGDDAAAQLFRNVIIQAYEEPRRATYDEQQQAIIEFRDAAALGCYQGPY